MKLIGKALVISDLHLGDGTGSDDFTYSDYRRLRDVEEGLLTKLRAINPDLLVLAGDTEDLWQHESARVRRVYKAFFEYTAAVPSVFLRGNHDSDNQDLTHLVLESGGKTVRVEHGHANDPAMRDPFQRFLVWCLGLVEKVFPSIDDHAIKIARLFGQSHIEKKSATLAKTMLQEYDYVVLGHTHVHQSDGRYFNCGTCQNGQFQGVLIEDGVLTLVS